MQALKYLDFEPYVADQLACHPRWMMMRCTGGEGGIFICLCVSWPVASWSVCSSAKKRERFDRSPGPSMVEGGMAQTGLRHRLGFVGYDFIYWSEVSLQY